MTTLLGHDPRYNAGCMSSAAKVDLYNHSYGNYSDEVYRQVRLETYGDDLGQTSWVTTEESSEIPKLLGLAASSYVFEIGSGSGRYALQLAEAVGCRILGADINAAGIATSNQLAAARNLDSLVKFEQCDAAQKLRLEDAAFDAIFSNDALCHIRDRASLFGELYRVLKPGGRLLFSDALVIGGTISNEELATRSSIGYYLFSPVGKTNDCWSSRTFACCARWTRPPTRPPSPSAGTTRAKEEKTRCSRSKAPTISPACSDSSPACTR